MNCFHPVSVSDLSAFAPSLNPCLRVFLLQWVFNSCLPILGCYLSFDCAGSRVPNLCWVPTFVSVGGLISVSLCLISGFLDSVSSVFGSHGAMYLFLKLVFSGISLRLSGSGGPRLFFFFQVSVCLLRCHGIGSDAGARGGEAEPAFPLIDWRRCRSSSAPPRSGEPPRGVLGVAVSGAAGRARVLRWAAITSPCSRLREPVGLRCAAGGSGRPALLVVGR